MDKPLYVSQPYQAPSVELSEGLHHRLHHEPKHIPYISNLTVILQHYLIFF